VIVIFVASPFSLFTQELRRQKKEKKQKRRNKEKVNNNNTLDRWYLYWFSLVSFEASA